VERFDAVVVGAGAAGSAAARSLAAAGRSCVLLERLDLGHTAGSSHGASRIFRLAYHDPGYVQLAQRALDAWRELESDAGELLLRRTGGLDIGERANVTASALEEAGVPFEWLSADDVEERWPALRMDGVDRALFQADAGVCAADRTLRALVLLAEGAGAEVRPRTPVEEIAPVTGGAEVRTPGGTIRAGVVVIAAGGWTGPLLEPLGVRLPLTVTLEQVLYVGRKRAEPVPTVIEWGDPYLYALADPSGDTLKAGEHHAKRVVTAEDRGFEPDPSSIDRVRTWIRRRFDALTDEERTETCLYTNTPDEDFVLDRIGPLVISSACSGHGFKFTPLIGRVLAELATGAEPSVPLDRFRSARFGVSVSLPSVR
jgi:sarcosine oxidase